jgi:hypothetical protein
MLLSGRRRSLDRRWFAVCAALAGAACGARTSLYSGRVPDAGAEPDADSGVPASCELDADCGSDPCAPMECREGTCAALPHVVCDDRDECTEDSCDSATGLCVYRPLALDLDGDGYKSPRPGFQPGAPGSCGDDCDDTSAAAHPGGVEICDGVDNDCNGVIDDGAQYTPGASARRISSTTLAHASTAGIAFDGQAYGTSYTGYTDQSHPYFQGLTRAGDTVVGEITTSAVNSDTFAGGLLFNGQFFGTSWQDSRQDGDYEVYFNRLDSKGKKLGPDLRVTDAPGKSLNPALAWNGAEFLDVWDDRRFDDGSSTDIRLFGQRIAVDGTLIGANVQLTSPGSAAEYASVAVGTSNVGIVYSLTIANHDSAAELITTDPDLSNPSSPVMIGASSVNQPHIVHVKGGYIAVWERTGSTVGSAIYCAAVEEQGHVLVPERAVTNGGPHARFPALLSLGESAVLVWAEDPSGQFDLYQETLGLDLTISSSKQRITTGLQSFNPATSFGPNGDVGVLFEGQGSGGAHQVYFASMSCVLPPPPPCCKH